MEVNSFKQQKDEKTVIKDKSGVYFWANAFAGKDSIAWHEFLDAFFRFFGGRYIPPANDRKERPEIIYFQYALQAMTGSDFLQWFGPLPKKPENLLLYANDELEKLLKLVHKLLTYKWFGGFLNKDEIERHLTELNKKGGFLVTFEAGVPGNFKIASMNKELKIVHQRISHLPGSTYRIGEFEYQTLKDLVESSAVKKNLYLKKPCVSASVPEIITRINTPSVMRLRNIEEEECNMDQLWDMPTDFNFDLEEKRLKEKFIGTVFCCHGNKVADNFHSLGIDVRVIPGNKFMVGGVSKKSVLMVLYEIRADTEENKRKPFDLVVVLDKSGSMRGAPLMFSLKAVTNIIDVMSPHDRIHFITYDNEATVVFENGSIEYRDYLLEQLHQVEAGGGTNIEAALNAAKDLLLRSGDESRSRRVFLFSDGEPSIGKLKPEELAEIANEFKEKYNIYTSSYGIGIEFDEKMMQAISDAGGGQYFYIDKPEKIPDLVREGVEGLISVVGTDAILSVDCTPNIAKIKKIYGNPAQITETGIEIGSLIKKNFIQVLVELEVDPSQQRPDTLVNIANFKLNFSTPESPCEISQELKINFIHPRDQGKCTAVEDEVFVNNQLRLAAEIDEQVLAYISESDFISAVNMKRSALRAMQKGAERDRIGVTLIPLLKSQKLFSEIKKMRWDNTIQASVIKHIHYNGYVSKTFR